MKDNASRREKILTEALLPLLIKTSVPTIIGMMMNMLYNLTDTFFIGQLNNKSMTAAIGIVFSFVSFVQAIPVRLHSAQFSKTRVYHILAGGAPNFSRQGITGVASVLLNMVAAAYGEGMIAALTVSSKIVATAFMIMIGWGQGFQPICAMNYGAKNYDRVKKARKLTISVGTVFLLCVAVLLAVFAVPASALLSKDEEVIRMSAEILRIQCISVPFLGYYTVSSMYMQNIGHYGSALLISIARQGFFYIPLLFLLPALAGQMGLFLVQPVADILSFAFSIIVVHFTPSQTPVSSAPFSSQ